jgi:group I intron endonuclease
MIIYKSTNKIDKKIYIGQTTQDLDKRIKNHLKESKNNIKRPFLMSLKKYGLDNFIFEVIDSASNLEELNEKEIFWINFYNSVSPNGYNLTGGGQGKKLISTKELRLRISEGLKNSEKWNKIINSEEYKKKMKSNFSGWGKGKKFTQEHKDKIWEKNKDRVLLYNENSKKKWIIVNNDNNIIRVTGKDEYFKTLGLCSGNFSRISKNLDNGKKIKRYYGYYCFTDKGQSDNDILKLITELDNHYNTEIKIYNRVTNEIKKLKKSEVYSFCISENYNYSTFLRMIKGRFKSYRDWVIKF